MSDQDLLKRMNAAQISRRKFLRGATGVMAGGLLASYWPTTAGAQSVTGPVVRPDYLGSMRQARPAPEGVLRYLSGEAFAGSWDPPMHTILANLHCEWNCFERLFEIAPVTGEFIPKLGLTYKVIPEGLELTLRRDVKFHDGQPFTAEDVKVTFERYSDKKGMRAEMFPGPVQVKVIDDYTCQMITDAPLPVLNLTAFCQVFSHLDDSEKLTQKQNGTGPFKWVKYEGETVYYEANMDYWAGPARLKELRLSYVNDPSTRLAALQKGEAEVSERVPGDHVAIVKGDPNLQLLTAVSGELIWLAFKMKSPKNQTVIQNKLVRQAFAHCINRQAIVEGIMGGYAAVPEGHLSTQSWPFGAPAGDSLPQYDLEKAKQKLAEAGYPDGNGLPELHIVGVTGFYANMKEYMEYIGAEAAKVGFKTRMDVREPAAWLSSAVREDDGDAIFHGWMPMTPEPDDSLRSLHRCATQCSFMCMPEVNDILDREATARDLESRAKIVRTELIPTLADLSITIPILNSWVILGANKNVKNFVAQMNSMFNLWDTYVETKV